MKYSTFQCSRIGATHIKKNLPRQDRTTAKEEDGVYIAASADGHGSRRHFRSEIGAEIACDTALEEISRCVREKGDLPSSKEEYKCLMESVAAGWQEKVQIHYQEHPWTEEELEEEKLILTESQYNTLLEEKDVLIPYGSTLCAVFVKNEKWGAIQIGDGSLTIVTTGGEYLWPMPKSLVNYGNKTSSLCYDPMKDFRFCNGYGKLTALLVYTDGIDKILMPEGNDLISFLHWVVGNEISGNADKDKKLERTLDILTQRSPIGDDLSIAGIVDREAILADPKPTIRQRKAEIDRIDANLKEKENTIRFNRQRMEKLDPKADGDAYRQLFEIIARKEKEAEKLRALRLDVQKDIDGESLGEEKVSVVPMDPEEESAASMPDEEVKTPEYLYETDASEKPAQYEAPEGNPDTL